MPKIDVIAFDADDTLWHNEHLYTMTKERFAQLLLPYHDAAWIDKHLYETEVRNLAFYGYGINSFVLSMVETAVELTEGRIRGHEIQTIIDFAKEMKQAPVDLLAGVAEVVAQLEANYTLMVITKGDLLDQETKVAASGLARYFKHVEVVSEKTPDIYRGVLAKYALAPEHFLMVGNSLKSDVLPIVAIGGVGVHIPYRTTWAHEVVSEAQKAEHDYYELTKMSQLPHLLAEIG